MQFQKRVRQIIKQHIEIAIVVLLSLLVLFPCLENGWVMWDDPAYVLNNSLLKVHSWEDIIEIFQTPNIQANYHPITILSLAIDYSIDGLNPFVFHATNLLIHLINVILVYLFVLKLLKGKILALVTAVLFAIHPMHIESFAWVSERKDVLYVCFFLIGLIQYLNYQKSMRTGQYLGVLLCFFLSLLSKGMAVVFAPVLLLIDYILERKIDKKVILEKVPFFILSLCFGLLVIWLQNDSNAISSTESYSIAQAFLVPIHGLLLYIVKVIIPFKLSALHPYPMMEDGNIPFMLKYSVIPLAIIIIALIKWFWSDRRIMFGLAFFIITIFPVLQFLSVGSAMISERYTYLSYLGLFIVLGLFLEKAYQTSSGLVKSLVISFSCLYILSLSYITHQRVTIWNNDESLWSDVIESYPNDYFAYFKRGSFRAKNGQTNDALVDLNKGISIFPYDYYLFNNRGMIHLGERKYELALKDFSKAIQLDSTLFEAHLNRGLIYLNINKHHLAEIDFNSAKKIAPNNPICYLNTALLYERMDSLFLAKQNYGAALKLDSLNADIYKYRGLLLLKLFDNQGALKDFNHFLEKSNYHPEGYYLKAKALLKLNRADEARILANQANSAGFILSNEELSEFYD